MKVCPHGTVLDMSIRQEGDTMITTLPYCPKCLGLPQGPWSVIETPMDEDGNFTVTISSEKSP
jgi:hypothetical protein